jgi:hypothetical protein
VLQPAAQPGTLGQERRIVELVEEVGWYSVCPHGLSRWCLELAANHCKLSVAYRGLLTASCRNILQVFEKVTYSQLNDVCSESMVDYFHRKI